MGKHGWNTETKLNRRDVLKQSAAVAAASAAVGVAHAGWCQPQGAMAAAASRSSSSASTAWTPVLSQRMIKAGLLAQSRQAPRQGGSAGWATSIPPQSPVAWASFINGAGPGSHGIFDFIHRHPGSAVRNLLRRGRNAARPKATGTSASTGCNCRFWPFNHEPPGHRAAATRRAVLGLPGQAGNSLHVLRSALRLPAQPVQTRHTTAAWRAWVRRTCWGTYGTYQHFAEDGPLRPGRSRRQAIRDLCSNAKRPRPDPDRARERPRSRRRSRAVIDFLVHRDHQANAAVIELPDRKVLLQAGQWSPWIKLDFRLDHAAEPVPDRHVTGICRFYLQEVAPNFRLYVTPINIDPSNPAVRISEPDAFVREISGKLGLFSTTGFQEDYKAPDRTACSPMDEFIAQAENVLEERIAAAGLRHGATTTTACCSSISPAPTCSRTCCGGTRTSSIPPSRLPRRRRCFAHVRRLYQRLDAVVGDILARYGSRATILVMSDHGFANFGRQFNLNSWLRDQGYLGPREAALDHGRRRLVADQGLRAGDQRAVPQSQRAGAGRHRRARHASRKRSWRNWWPGSRPSATSTASASSAASTAPTRSTRAMPPRLAPDLIVGYSRGYRASWATCLGGLTEAVLLDNDSAWSADHCADRGSARRAVQQPAHSPPAAVAGRRGAVDPGRVRTAHPVLHGGKERFLRIGIGAKITVAFRSAKGNYTTLIDLPVLGP